MEFYQLNGFYETAKRKSISKAAEVTYRTPSALSQQIKALEEEFGCLLFERVGNRIMRLTLAGENLFNFAHTLKMQRKELIEQLHEIKGGQVGRIRISGQFASFYFLLPDIINRYRKEFPLINVKLFEHSFHDTIPLMQSGDIDFGIYLEEMLPKDLKAIRIKKANNVLITPKGHPLTKEKKITLEKIALYPLILPPKRSKMKIRYVYHDKFLKRGINTNIAMEASTIELGSKYVEMGIGISIAPEGFELDSVKARNLTFISINHLIKEEYISIILRKDIVLQSHKQAFINMILGQYSKDR